MGAKGKETDGAARRAQFRLGERVALGVGLIGLGLTLAGLGAPALAGTLSVERAWVAPHAEVGADVGFFMTVKNDDSEPDALVRASCPFANFAEKRAVDVGEGGLADRVISNIPIAAHSTLTMDAKSYHVALLQTRDRLDAGASFTCNVAFRRAGAMEVKVTISPSPP